jgi:hypothetical protein
VAENCAVISVPAAAAVFGVRTGNSGQSRLLNTHFPNVVTTVDSEILGSRVCGGSKIAEKKIIEKCWILSQLPLDASTLANTLLVNSLLFTAGLLGPKSHRKQAEKHLEVWCSFWNPQASISSAQAVQRHLWTANTDIAQLYHRVLS